MSLSSCILYSIMFITSNTNALKITCITELIEKSNLKKFKYPTAMKPVVIEQL